MNKYKHKIPRDDLKRFAKEIAKKLVASDFKAGRVKDPTKIDERQQKKVKEFCKQFFEKAAHKHKKHEEEKAARRAKKAAGRASAVSASPGPSPTPENASPDVDIKKEEVDDEDVRMSDEEGAHSTPTLTTPATPSERNGALKRKRLDESDHDVKDEDDPTRSPLKKLSMETPPPPPPPPAPPIETPPASTPREDVDIETDIHADTNFRSRSMADVLAQAQQEDDDDDDEGGGAENGEMEIDGGDSAQQVDTKFEAELKGNGLLEQSEALGDRLVHG